jgi:hypothetical protein
MGERSRQRLTRLPPGLVNMRAVAHPILPKPITYPIELSATTQFLPGVAALVFVSPNVIDASQDHAEFGLRVTHPEAEIDDRYEFVPPHPDARLVAWFRPAEAERTYLIELEAFAVGSFTLVDEGGVTEVVQPSPGSLDRWGVSAAHVSRTFPGGTDWRWFSFSNEVWWSLSKCRIRQL